MLSASNINPRGYIQVENGTEYVKKKKKATEMNLKGLHIKAKLAGREKLFWMGLTESKMAAPIW